MGLEVLLRAVRDNHHGAWSRLVGPLSITLELYFERRVNSEYVSDLVQETLTSIFKDLPGLEPRISLVAWMNGVARHKMQDHYRGIGRRRDEHLEPFQYPLPSSEVERKELCTLVYKELPHLPKGLREVIENDLAGGDPKALARKEGITLATVRTRRHRAHELLRMRVRQRTKTPTPPLT